MNKVLYLTGYENDTVNSFLKKLKYNGITRVIDVREYPLSRKRGFSKLELEKILNRSNIKYTHIQPLGSPRDIRQQLKTNGDYITFFKNYRFYIKNKHIELQRVLNYTVTDKVCVMCLEKDCDLCHRTILADEILKIQPALQVITV